METSLPSIASRARARRQGRANLAPIANTEVALPQLIPITDPGDLRIAPYRDVRERDLVGRQGLFIAEGEVVVRRLIASVLHELVSLLVAVKRLRSKADWLEALPQDAPVYAASQEVMDRIVGFHIHRGILAIGRPRTTPSAEALLAQTDEDAIVAVLIGLSNHDNVGGVFRNAASFGADAVILDAECCDPLYRKAIRVSVGAALTLPFARLVRGADPLAPLGAAGFEAVALTPDGETPLIQAPRPKRLALLLGAEGPGLDETLTRRCRTVRIEMGTGLDSLNVATASGIALHHFTFGTPSTQTGEGSSRE